MLATRLTDAKSDINTCQRFFESNVFCVVSATNTSNFARSFFNNYHRFCVRFSTMEACEEAVSARVAKINASITGKSFQSDAHLDLIRREALLDALQALYDECCIETLQRGDKNVLRFADKYKNSMLELKKLRVNIADFEVKDVIGRGQFGDVHVVREKQTGDVYAMKTIKKSNSPAFDIEKDIMASNRSHWLTGLQYAFQDSLCLYFVMEFHAGGDLLGLLYRQGGTLPESAATFYIGEIVLALEDLHQMGYVHRDIKPDNVLLDRCGHLKLADFGSAAKLDKNGKVKGDSGMPVGTPDYVAPEVLRCLEGKSNKAGSYGTSCDFWSLGVLAYELTIGKAPFSGQNTATTYAKIMAHSTSLNFPPQIALTQAFVSLLRGLLTDSKTRLGLKQIKEHAVFQNLHFDTLRDQVPPYVPKVTSVDDTSNFTEVSAKAKQPTIENFKRKTQFSGRNLPFVGFTYTHDTPSFDFIGRPSSGGAKNEIIKQLNQELDVVRRKCEEHLGCDEEKMALSKKLGEKTQKLEAVESARSKLEKDLSKSLADSTALKRTLDLERKDRSELEKTALDLIKSAKSKWEASGRAKAESHRLELEERDEKIQRLEATNQILSEQLQHALKLEGSHRQSISKVEQLGRRSVIGLESRLEKVTFDANSTINTLRSQLDQESEMKRHAQKQLENSKNNLKDVLGKLKTTENNYSLLKMKISEAEAIIADLQSKIRSMERELDRKESDGIESTEFKKQIDSLEKELKETEMKYEMNRVECREKEEKYKEELEGLKRFKVQNEKKINELESLLESEKEKCQRLKGELKENDKNPESQELKEMRTKLWRMEKELGNCKIDKRILERELKDAEAQNKELNAKMQKLNESIDNNNRNHARAMLELSGINESLSLELFKVKEAHKALEANFANERDKCDGEKLVIEELKGVIRSKDEKIAEDADLIAQLKAEKTQSDTKLASFQAKYDVLDKQLDQYEKQKQRLLNEMADLKNQMRSNKETMLALREACEMLEGQVIGYEKVVEERDNEKAKISENTEKLVQDLCKAKQDVQDAKKMWNEEKSLRLLAEAKAKRLNEDIECWQKEASSYKVKALEYKENMSDLAEQLTAAEEKIVALEIDLKNSQRDVSSLVEETNGLKEEIAQCLTNNASLKDTIAGLKRQVQDGKNAATYLNQKIEFLEATINEKLNYHKEREIKADATMQQQRKLIDYLQSKNDEHQNKKRTLADKLFGTKKENVPPPMVVMSYSELEMEMQKQKEKNDKLQQDLFKLKAELFTAKNDKITDKFSKKVQRHKSEVVKRGSSKTSVAEVVTSPVTVKARQNSTRRVYHNIPHRFESSKSKTSSTCDSCYAEIAKGSDVTVCTECSTNVHASCTKSLKQGTCGLPKEYVGHLENGVTELIGSACNDTKNTDMEGWVKILNSNMKTWDRRFARLTSDARLTISETPTSTAALEVMSLAEGRVILEPLSSEIGVVVADNDLPFVLKVEFGRGQSLAFMTLTIPERDQWFKCFQKIFCNESLDMETVLDIPDTLYVNCTADLTENIRILGTRQGLYSRYNGAFLRIEGVTDVTKIVIFKSIKAVVMIKNGVLISCDLSHLINLTQCAPCTKPTLTYKEIVSNLKGFHFLHASTGDKHDKEMFCAATSKRIVIAEYRLEDNCFVPLTAMDTALPVGCALFTEHSLIVGADKLFEIDLATFKAEEFLDNSDLRLKPILKCSQIGSYPLGALSLSSTDPREYLVCFAETCAFVDEYGTTSRRSDIKPSIVASSFHYVKPYVYVLGDRGVEIIKVELVEDEEDVKIERVRIDTTLRLVGYAKKGLYVVHDGKIKILKGDLGVDVSFTETSMSEDDDRFTLSSSIVRSLDGSEEDVAADRKVTFSGL